MSIELRCAKCGWKTEYPDGTHVFELPTTCPTCNVSTQAFAIAHWIRDMHPISELLAWIEKTSQATRTLALRVL